MENIFVTLECLDNDSCYTAGMRSCCAAGARSCCVAGTKVLVLTNTNYHCNPPTPPRNVAHHHPTLPPTSTTTTINPTKMKTPDTTTKSIKNTTTITTQPILPRTTHLLHSKRALMNCSGSALLLRSQKPTFVIFLEVQAPI